MSMPSGTPTSQAIPYFLRAMRGTRAPEWINTPQGPILRQVESRLQTIFIEERQIESAGQAIDELERIIARIKFLTSQAKSVKTRLIDVPKAVPVQTPVKAPEAKRALKPEPILQDLPKSEMDEIYEMMVNAMASYIKTGDITSVVPAGYFTSADEASLWSHFTMASINQINGRTLHATKLSNSKALNAVVMKSGISATPGKCAILQDDNKLIVAVLALGDEADQLSRTFNALYRR